MKPTPCTSCSTPVWGRATRCPRCRSMRAPIRPKADRNDAVARETIERNDRRDPELAAIVKRNDQRVPIAPVAHGLGLTDELRRAAIMTGFLGML